MPVLTDRKEPDDYDKERNPDEPNDYAIKYLFGMRKPQQERWRSGRVLFYSGASANLLATFMLVVAAEFNLSGILLLFGLAILAASGLAVFRVWKYHHGEGEWWVSALPLLILGLGLLASLTVLAQVGDLWMLLYYIPGALVMLVGTLMFRPLQIKQKD
jgi:hypothetical protein